MKSHASERQKKALEMLRAGAGIAEVHAGTGYSYPHIRSLASAEGISLAKRNVGQQTVRVLGLLRRGLNNSEAARELGCSSERVRQIKEAALNSGALLPGDLE